MIEDKQYGEMFETATELLTNCSPGERVMCMFLGAILSELRTLRIVSNNTDDQLEKLAKQFNQVSAGGNALITERVS